MKLPRTNTVRDTHSDAPPHCRRTLFYASLWLLMLVARFPPTHANPSHDVSEIAWHEGDVAGALPSSIRITGGPALSLLLHSQNSLMMYTSPVQVTEIMAPPSFTISTARQRFFALFQAVTGHRGRKVVITSRGSENHAVLVGESYLNELEAAAKRLRDIESGKAHPAADFKLIGSGRIADGVDDPLADIRRDANALWERKLVSFDK